MIFLFTSINGNHINKYTNTETSLHLWNKFLWSCNINLLICYLFAYIFFRISAPISMSEIGLQAYACTWVLFVIHFKSIFTSFTLSDIDLTTSFLRVPYNDLLYTDYSETDLLNINIRFDIYLLIISSPVFILLQQSVNIFWLLISLHIFYSVMKRNSWQMGQNQCSQTGL